MAIRQNPDSPSASPRSGAPKGELEQYGVWVKAEPQDIVEEAALPLGDFDLPEEPETKADATFLSEDEEKLLGSFDAEFETAPAAAGADLSALPSIDELPEIDETLLDSSPPLESSEVEDLGSSTIDISLEDLDDNLSSSGGAARLDMELGGIDALGSHAEARIPSPVMEDVSADFMEEISPSAGPAEDVTAEFLDAAEPSPKSAVDTAESPEEFESLDMDLHFDDTLPQAEAGSEGAASLPGFEAVTEFDDFLSSGPAKEPEATDGFDDVAALERELSEAPAKAPVNVPASAQGPASAPAKDLSTEILLKIADELSSIRGELVSLKTQLGTLRKEAESAVQAEQPSSLEKEEDAGQAGGFFDEEEDETIALTGDELDNILNTADFTEEAAEEAVPEGEVGVENLAELSIEAEVPEPTDTSLLAEDLLPESGDYAAAAEALAEAPAIEEVRLGQQPLVAEAEEAQAISVADGQDFSEIGLMAEEGVLPMTEAPEDTSYLEETEVGSETLAEPGIGEITLSDVPLVEPDLSSFETEELEAEPIPEIEEELPLVEEAEILPDIDLSIEHIAEAETIEPELEAEPAHLGEINLHEENLEPIPEFEEIESLASEPLTLAEEIESKTVKAAEPVSLHPDEIPSSLDEALFVEEAPAEKEPAKPLARPEAPVDDVDRLKTEIRSVLSYLDKLLDSLPEDKIEEFARSEHFDTYKKLFEELGLV